ncbi:MAG: hypothetical protein RIS35_3383 [Pseudomonadota bacterium]|jgi:hypothetical protein
MAAVEISTVSRARSPGKGIALYATVRNEIYFVPHFLAHYRKLGISEFCFLDDRSDDGTTELLARQPDVTLLRANLRFGEMCGRLRFGIASRTLVPRKMYPGRWVLTADLDEFLLLPPEIPDLPALVGILERHGLSVARALMIDFYPTSLEALEAAPPTAHPLDVAPNFDILPPIDWPDGASAPRKGNHSASVRNRMFSTLFRRVPEAAHLRGEYRRANVNKVPLIRWSNSIEMLSAHRPNVSVSASTQLIFRHHKFYPGLRGKIRDALLTGAYWNQSIEYRMLDLAWRFMRDEDLRSLGGHRRHTTDQTRLWTDGLLYCRL